jgi:hypothetical protein
MSAVRPAAPLSCHVRTRSLLSTIRRVSRSLVSSNPAFSLAARSSSSSPIDDGSWTNEPDQLSPGFSGLEVLFSLLYEFSDKTA